MSRPAEVAGNGGKKRNEKNQKETHAVDSQRSAIGSRHLILYVIGQWVL